MNEDQVRRRLMTTLSAAVRIGRSSGLTDNQVGAELQDLADLYLAAVQAVRFPPVTAWELGQQPEVDLKVYPSEETLSEAAPAVCGFELATYVDSGEEILCSHICQKAPGHADGESGSDHQCEFCGCLYDAAGGTAAPLAMTGLPLGGNGPAAEAEEIEL